MPACLIVATDAEKLADEILRVADIRIPVTCCTSADEALAAYSGETILFGNPEMIAAILPDLPPVDWVQSSWAGVTPLVALERRDYVLTGVKGVFGPQMADYVMAYLLAHELQLVERREQQRRGNWFTGASGGLQGKHLGIMGTGSIGQYIARSAACMGIRVSGLNRSGSPAPGFEQVAPVTKLHDFLEPIDYLVSTLPQTINTDRLLDAAALSRLPAHAYFINLGRSNVVDDAALIDALRHGKLAGAALDVFDDEPLPECSPLWRTPNLSITAHIAAISHPALIVPIFVDNYRRYLSKKALNYVVDFDAGY